MTRKRKPTKDAVKKRAAKLRLKPTGSEYLLLFWLKKKGESVSRQVPVGLCVIDLAIPQRNLLIEIDGESHIGKEGKDERRDLWLKGLGFHVARVTKDEVLSDPETIVSWLLRTHPIEEDGLKLFKAAKRLGDKTTFNK